MIAYSYTAKHIPSGRFYYGVRKSESFDIGIIYFTSSKLVKSLIEKDGITSFEFKIRRTFNSYEAARFHETKILKRIKAVSNIKMLNQAITGARVPSKDSNSESIRRKKISDSMKIIWKTEQYRSKQPKFSKEEMSRLGKLGAAKRQSNKVIENGGIIPEKKKKQWPKTYKDVQIIRNGIIKTIKQNQTSVYKSCGWEILKFVAL